MKGEIIMRANERAEDIVSRIDRIEENIRIADEIDSYYHEELMKMKEDIGKIMKYLEAQNNGVG